MKKIFVGVVAIVFWGSNLASGESFDLQARIDTAASGEIVAVPPGVYRGNFRLKAGVILSGSGAESTVLDGGGSGWVLTGAEDSLVKGFTITNAGGGINSTGRFMGIFENVIRDIKGSGIYLGGGGGAVVNNLIFNNAGKGGIDLARSGVLISNNTLCQHPVGLSCWKTEAAVVVNNIVAYSGTGILLDEESDPEIRNNLFWSNRQDIMPDSRGEDNICLDPFSMDPGSGDYRLRLDSPLRAMGIAVRGLPEEITAAVGCVLPLSFPLDTYQALFQQVKAEMLQCQPVVIYEPLEEDGSFGVTTRFSRPDFTVKSSTPSTPIDEIEAFDSGDSDSLLSRLVPDEQPAVEVWGWGGKTYPRERDRYVMDSIFCRPESCFRDKEGNLHFRRETNFGRIRIVIPEGYEVKNLVPEGKIEPEDGLISILNPGSELLEIDLVLSP